MATDAYEIKRMPIQYGEYMDFDKVQRHYDFIKKHLAQKVAKGERLRVAFFVLFDSIFQSKALFKAMLDDDMFEPFIVLIPDTRHDVAHLLGSMEKQYLALSHEFRDVFKSYTEENGFIDFANEADLICFNNVYESFTHEPYTMQYAIKTKALPFVMSYGLYISQYSQQNIMNLATYNSAWINFVDTQDILEDFKVFSLAKGRNTFLSGYGKMDDLANYPDKPRSRKKVIIAPHHTIKKVVGNFELSNFIEYAEFFLELPKKYPDIDFVFRPHPVLFERLCHPDFWTSQQIEEYLRRMTSMSNVEYQKGGDYLETFAQSDGLIHDCGSFLAEYLYTGKPVCFMVKNEQIFSHFGTKIGSDCLKQHYLARNWKEIIHFMDNVIVDGKDDKKEERVRYAEKSLKVNYPHASKTILDHIKTEIVDYQ